MCINAYHRMECGRNILSEEGDIYSFSIFNTKDLCPTERAIHLCLVGVFFSDVNI